MLSGTYMHTAILERVGGSGDDVGVCERLLPMPLPKHESDCAGPIGGVNQYP